MRRWCSIAKFFAFVISFILKNLYNTINSHVDNGNGIEYIIIEDGFPKDEKLKRFSSLPKLAGNDC